jgi:hypothetical protein
MAGVSDARSRAVDAAVPRLNARMVLQRKTVDTRIDGSPVGTLYWRD